MADQKIETGNEIEITNCHVHLFNKTHSPRHYPSKLVAPVKRFPWLAGPIAWLVRVLGSPNMAEQILRLRRFQTETDLPAQQNILENVRLHYPDNTRFVVLPMDLSQIGHGEVPVPLSQQHDELADLARHKALGASVIPFATIDPRADPEAKELWRAIDDLGFKGIKIYPRLGFPPDHPVLMAHVYPRAEAMGLPIMSHCSRGGVQGRTRHDGTATKPLDEYWADRYTEPGAVIPVLKAFPWLRFCLAHFGGSRDWAAYVNPEQPTARTEEHDPARNWQRQIREMIGSGLYDNLWTDISYTLFDFEENIPFLRHFLTADGEKAERLRHRVLFGSDYYMTRQEILSERAVCFRLRNELGEKIFRQIADDNPKVWLGEAEDRLDREAPTFASGR